MLEATGDLWTYPADMRCITTNGFVKLNGHAVMGRGCAREAAQKWPELPKELGTVLMAKGNKVRIYEPAPLVTFPVKHAWFEKADPDLIVKSAKELVALTDLEGWKSVVIPRPGCGNGQLKWEDVKPLLEPILDDRFTIITFGAQS